MANRYVIAGMLRDMRHGYAVAYIGGTQTDTRYTFELAAAELAPHERANRANGRERVDSPTGGRVIFLTAGTGGGRGHAPDVIVYGRSNRVTLADYRDTSAALNTSRLDRADRVIHA